MKTLTEAIKEDHDEMYEYYTAYKKAEGEKDFDAAARWAHQLRWEVARHAVGEELVVYPLMEAKLGAKGKALADHDRQEHTQVKELLARLDTLEAGTAAFHTTITQVMDHLKPHNDDEEREDLPLLEPAIGPDASRAAAATFSRTKKFVPTRTHPSFPNQPPYETFAGFLAMPIDALRDYFATWPTAEQKKEAGKEYEEGGGRAQLEQ